MLVNFGFWIYIFTTCSLISHLFAKIRKQELALDYHVLQGLILLSIFLVGFNLFLPINGVAHAIVISASAGSAIYCKVEIRKSMQALAPPKIFVPAMVFIGLLFLANSANSNDYYDGLLYHIQAIFWKTQFATVPGLGVLHDRFAFNSTSLTLNAFFSNSLHRTYALNSFLFLLLSGRIFFEVLNFKNTLRFGRVFLLNTVFFILYFTEIYQGINNSSQDAITAIWIVYTFLFLTEKPERQVILPDFAILMLLFLPALKISGVFYPLLLLPYLFRNPAKFKWVSVLACFIFIPYLLTNYVYSGYFIYPAAGTGIFHPDWQIPLKTLLNVKRWITSWARHPGVHPDEVLNQGFAEWSKYWFVHIDRTAKVITEFSFFVFVAVSIRIKKMDRFLLSYYGVFLLSMALWFWSAPDFRFVFGTLTVFIGLAATACLGNAKNDFYLKTKVRFGLAILLVLFIVAKKEKYAVPDLSAKWMHPLNPPARPWKEIQINGIVFHTPITGDQCGDTPLPCTPYPDLKLHLRGASLAQGFKISD